VRVVRDTNSAAFGAAAHENSRNSGLGPMLPRPVS